MDVLYASAGQTLKAGDTIARLNLTELQDALDAANVTLSQQQAELAQLTASPASSTSTADSARQTLTRAQEDYARTGDRTQAAVDEADAALTQALQAQDEAASRLEELQAQTEAGQLDFPRPGCRAVCGTAGSGCGASGPARCQAFLAHPLPMERLLLVGADSADTWPAAGDLPSGPRHGAGSGNQNRTSGAGGNRISPVRAL